MRMIDLKRLILVLATLLPVAMAAAQEEPLEEEPEVRRFTVEMIVFRYAQEMSPGTEIFVGEPLPPVEYPEQDSETAFPGDDPEGEIPLVEDPVDESQEDAVDGEQEDDIDLRDKEFVLLEDDELTMNEIMGHLKRLDVYEPMMHFGWTQAAWPEEETEAIQLTSLALPPDGLDGTLKLYLSRFLHLVVDLKLDAPGTAVPDEPLEDAFPSYDGFGTIDSFGSVEALVGPVRYHIEEDRIFRSGELRYFDHPKFGVLARINRVEEEETDEDAPQGTELLGYPPE